MRERDQEGELERVCEKETNCFAVCLCVLGGRERERSRESIGVFRRKGVTLLVCTVPTSNYCTYCPGIINDRTPDAHTVCWAWMRTLVPDLTSENSELCGLGLFFLSHYPWDFVQLDACRQPIDCCKN